MTTSIGRMREYRIAAISINLQLGTRLAYGIERSENDICGVAGYSMRVNSYTSFTHAWIKR